MKHTLVAPPSVAAILSQLVANSGWSLDATALSANMTTKHLRKLLNGKPLHLDDVAWLARALGRRFPAFLDELMAAERALQEWQREDERLVRRGAKRP